MADKNAVDPGELKLRNVIISFPHVHKPQEGMVDKQTGKKGDPKYNCSLLISKSDKAQLKAIADAKTRVCLAKYGTADKIPKYKPEKLCYRDGDLESWEGYAGCIYLSASSPMDRKPKVIDRDRSDLAPDSGKIYGGAVVNAVVRLWVQDSPDYGKRVNASLEAVQFVRHGTAFGARPVDVNEAFDDLSGEDDDMAPEDRAPAGEDDDLLG